MKKRWWIIGVIIIGIIFIIGYFFIYPISGTKCNLKCKSQGYESGFCETIATVPKVIQIKSILNNAFNLGDKYCLQDGTLGHVSECLCKKKTISEYYIACGCGGDFLCNDQLSKEFTLPNRIEKIECLYHSKEDNLQKIIEEDKKVLNNTNCSNPSPIILYHYCD